MARLSKDDLKRHESFEFKEEEVEVPGLGGGTILVRSLSVEQREELQKNQPEKEEDWTLRNTAQLFSIVVADPDVTPEEAEEFLAKWPGEALDSVLAKFTEMMGQSPEETRDAAGEFPDQDE